MTPTPSDIMTARAIAARVTAGELPSENEMAFALRVLHTPPSPDLRTALAIAMPARDLGRHVLTMPPWEGETKAIWYARVGESILAHVAIAIGPLFTIEQARRVAVEERLDAERKRVAALEGQMGLPAEAKRAFTAHLTTVIREQREAVAFDKYPSGVEQEGFRRLAFVSGTDWILSLLDSAEDGYGPIAELEAKVEMARALANAWSDEAALLAHGAKKFDAGTEMRQFQETRAKDLAKKVKALETALGEGREDATTCWGGGLLWGSDGPHDCPGCVACEKKVAPVSEPLLTPVAGGHVFAGTWEVLAEIDTATCAACGEHIKEDGEAVDVVEIDGAGVHHRMMCWKWTQPADGALVRLVRGLVRRRWVREDDNDLLPSLPSHEARVELHKVHWDACQPGADARDSLHRIGTAFEALCVSLSDEEHALRLALEHDLQTPTVEAGASRPIGVWPLRITMRLAEPEAKAARLALSAAHGYLGGVPLDEDGPAALVEAHRALARGVDVDLRVQVFADGRKAIVGAPSAPLPPSGSPAHDSAVWADRAQRLEEALRGMLWAYDINAQQAAKRRAVDVWNDLQKSTPPLGGPKTHNAPTGAGDYDIVCEGCGEIVAEPHTWTACTEAMRAERVRLRDLLVDRRVVDESQADARELFYDAIVLVLREEDPTFTGDIAAALTPRALADKLLETVRKERRKAALDRTAARREHWSAEDHEAAAEQYAQHALDHRAEARAHGDNTFAEEHSTRATALEAKATRHRETAAQLRRRPKDAPISDPAERARAVARELRRRGIWARCYGWGAVHAIAYAAPSPDGDFDEHEHRIEAAEHATQGPIAIADTIQAEEARRAQEWAGDE